MPVVILSRGEAAVFVWRREAEVQLSTGLLLCRWLLFTGDVQHTARCADGQKAIRGQKGGDGLWIYTGWDLKLPVKLLCHNAILIL